MAVKKKKHKPKPKRKMKTKTHKHVSKKHSSKKKAKGKRGRARDKFSVDWVSLENQEWKADWDDDAGDFEGETPSTES